MNEARVLKVFVVEDDESMRCEFERMVRGQPQLALLGSSGSAVEARQLLVQTAPDVAIVDLGLPDGDGAELIELLRQTSPDTAVLVSTVFGDEAHVIRAIEAGARGYLLKDAAPDEFVRSIRMVYDGDAPLSPQIARHLLKRFAGSTASRAASLEANRLTSREVDILTRISQGFSAMETAGLISISPHTVTTHIKNIYKKLAVRNRVEAVNEARRKGLIR
jgi:DNA-binding NarL/FixJ family response regulator